MSRSPDAHRLAMVLLVRLRCHDELVTKTRTLSLRVPAELVEDFRRAAGTEDRSIAGEVRHLMRKRVALQRDEGPAHKPTPVTTPAAGPAGNVQPTR